MPIELRYKTWFATLRVPDDVRDKLGRWNYRKTLKTESRTVALRRAAPLISGWKEEIAKARGEADDAEFWTGRGEPTATWWRGRLRRAKGVGARDEYGRPTDDRALIEDLIDDAATEIGFAHVDIGQAPSSSPEAQEFHATATGARVTTLDHLDEYMGSLGHLKGKTVGMARAAIERLGQRFRFVRDVTRPSVRRWVTELSGGLAGPTVQRILSDCRGYWVYLATIEVVPEDVAPFDKLGLKARKVSWLGFEPAEVVALVTGAEARGDGQLADLIRLAMYSGARREELCALRIENVKADRFDITEAKTAAGVRTVPVHPELRQTMARMVAASTDGYVLAGLAPNRNGDRGDGIGKRFTRLKQSLGFDGQHVFHSLRGTVITLLEREGVPESTVQDIVGHERSTLTGSTYSGKSTLAMKAAAIEKPNYPG